MVGRSAVPPSSRGPVRDHRIDGDIARLETAPQPAVAALATTGVGLLCWCLYSCRTSAARRLRVVSRRPRPALLGRPSRHWLPRQTSGKTWYPRVLLRFQKSSPTAQLNRSNLVATIASSVVGTMPMRRHTAGRCSLLKQLESRFGSPVAQRLVSWQPYLSPLGGVLLIWGHLVNIRCKPVAAASMSMARLLPV